MFCRSSFGDGRIPRLLLLLIFLQETFCLFGYPHFLTINSISLKDIGCLATHIFLDDQSLQSLKGFSCWGLTTPFSFLFFSFLVQAFTQLFTLNFFTTWITWSKLIWVRTWFLYFFLMTGCPGQLVRTSTNSYILLLNSNLNHIIHETFRWS